MGLKEKAQPGDVTSAGWANKRRNIKEKRGDEEWLLEMKVDFFQPFLDIEAGTL